MERFTGRKVIKMYKIQWDHHTEEETTWETAGYLNQHFRGFVNPLPDTCSFHT
jgi:hypothetical protein